MLIASQGSKAPPNVELIDTLLSWDKLDEDTRKRYAKEDRLWNGWRRHEELSYATYNEAIPAFDVVIDMSWAKWAYQSKKEEVIGICHSMKSYTIPPPQRHPMFVGVSNGHAHFLTRELRVPHRVLWNPVNVKDYPFQKDKGERILSFNRIMPQKGIHHFVNICDSKFIYGDVAGDDSKLVPDQGYVEMIKRRCQGSAYLKYHGLVDEKKRLELLANAKCLVCLKDMGYEEIFGLSAVEALACGTPVVAARSWGFEDIIEDGKTGFLVDRLEDIPKFIEKTKEINPEDCRARAKFFARRPRSEAYLKLLEAVKKGCRW